MRISLSVVFLLGALVACSDSSTAPDATEPPAQLSIFADTTMLREAQPFGVRIRGGSTSDSVAALIGGAPAATRIINDSVVEVLMPLGPAGATTLQVRVGRGATPRVASLNLTRVAAPAVALPAAFLDSLRGTIGGTVAELEAQAAPAGVAPAAWTASVAVAAQMADSLTRSIARLTPEQQSEAARIIAAVESAFGASAAVADPSSVAAPECAQTRAAALLCLEATNTTLRQDLRRFAAGVALIGVGSLLLSLVPPVGVVVAAYGVALSANAGLSMYERVYAALGSPAILAELQLPPFDESVRDRGVGPTASLEEPRIFVPGAGQVVELRVRSRNPLPTDVNVPIVGDLLPLVAELAQRWNELMERLPTPFQLSAPGFQSTITDELFSGPEPGEVRVVSVSAPGITAAVGAASGGVALTLNGDPGPNGQTLTVTLAAGNSRVGERTVAVPLLLEREETVRLVSATMVPRCTPEEVPFDGEWVTEDGTNVNPQFCQVRWYGSRDVSWAFNFSWPFRPLGYGGLMNAWGLMGSRLWDLTVTLARPLPAPILGIAGLRNYRGPDPLNRPPLPAMEFSPYSGLLFCRRASEGTPLPTTYLTAGNLVDQAWVTSCAAYGIQDRTMIIGEQVSGNQVSFDVMFNPGGAELPPDFELYVAIVRAPGGRDVFPGGIPFDRCPCYAGNPVFVPADWVLTNLVRVPLP